MRFDNDDNDDNDDNHEIGDNDDIDKKKYYEYHLRNYFFNFTAPVTYSIWQIFSFHAAFKSSQYGTI